MNCRRGHTVASQHSPALAPSSHREAHEDAFLEPPLAKSPWVMMMSTQRVSHAHHHQCGPWHSFCTAPAMDGTVEVVGSPGLLSIDCKEKRWWPLTAWDGDLTSIKLSFIFSVPVHYDLKKNPQLLLSLRLKNPFLEAGALLQHRHLTVGHHQEASAWVLSE